jgi:hypothetical protein
LALPGDLMPFARDSRLREMLPSSTAVTGRLLSLLLPSSAGVAPTLGQATAQECREHWRAFYSTRHLCGTAALRRLETDTDQRHTVPSRRA